MVSQDSPTNPTSSNILRHFINSDSINAQQPHFEYQQFDAYGSSLRSNIDQTYPHSFAVLPSSIHSLGERMSRSIDLAQSHPIDQDHGRGPLSLSLGIQMPFPSVQRTFNSDLISSNYLLCGEATREMGNQGNGQLSHEYSFPAGAFASSSTSIHRSCSTSYGTESFASFLGNSKYLKPAQSLLKEVVNMGSKAADIISNNEMYGRRGSTLGLCAELKAELCNSGLFSAEKHEHQVTMSKLISFLEEVDGRYEKYCNQMEEAVSSFEAIAGLGAAKSYTALALQAMSRHFSNLRDAILNQIKVERRKILQSLPKINAGLSRLSLFDRETRNSQMTLQRLGMFQSPRQVWRPIRGLPETSVTILRSWLFEHFLHPYPNDSEKLMLASQTGLTKNQVSNWFINARVRLWKPMIEEMYKEEFGDSSEDSNPLAFAGSMTGEAGFIEDQGNRTESGGKISS